MTRKKVIEMEIINTSAAGIDIGSRSHYVAVGQSLQDVKEFGVYAEDLIALCEWLLPYGITTVAMESTGDYWQNLFTELVKHDIEVILCNGKFTKHPKGKKTDVKDCRHIQKLHALGLLYCIRFSDRINNFFCKFDSIYLYIVKCEILDTICEILGIRKKVFERGLQELMHNNLCHIT